MQDFGSALGFFGMVGLILTGIGFFKGTIPGTKITARKTIFQLAGAGAILFSIGAAMIGPTASTTNTTAQKPAQPQPILEPKKDPWIMIAQCHDLISNQLKAPSTAVFEGNLDANQPREIKNGDLLWNSYVDAENSFGAKLRNHFVCSYTKKTDAVKAVLLKQ